MSDRDDFSPPKNPNFLRKQLERTRLERALEIVREMADTNKFLNSTELARLNNILCGEKGEPWRDGVAEIALKSGNKASFHMIADPISHAREILTRAKDRAANGQVVEAASELYADLVLNHLFKDGNRRTAVLASCYLLELYGFDVSPMAVHDLGLGDLREKGQKEAISDLFKSLVKITPIKRV